MRLFYEMYENMLYEIFSTHFQYTLTPLYYDDSLLAFKQRFIIAQLYLFCEISQSSEKVSIKLILMVF